MRHFHPPIATNNNPDEDETHFTQCCVVYNFRVAMIRPIGRVIPGTQYSM